MFKKISRTKKLFGGFVVGGFGLMAMRQYQKTKMQHPIVDEAMEILRHEKQVRELVGYPINFKNRLNQKYSITHDSNHNEVVYFDFYVRGPKGEINVVISGSSIPLYQASQTNVLDSYYIPDKPTLALLDQQVLKPHQKHHDLNDDQKLWKIDYMYADVGPSLRITLQQQDTPITPTNKKINEQNITPTTKKISEQNMKYDQMIQYLLEKKQSHQIKNLVRDDLMEMSDAELEETRRMRMNQMYQSAGSARFFLFGAVLVGGMGYYLFVVMNKKTNISNSIIHRNAIEIIKNNVQIRSHLGQQNTLVFGQHVRGHQVNNKGQFEFDVLSARGRGVAQVNGTFDDNSGDWVIDSLVFQLHQDKKTQDIKII